MFIARSDRPDVSIVNAARGRDLESFALVELVVADEVVVHPVDLVLPDSLTTLDLRPPLAEAIQRVLDGPTGTAEEP